MAQKTSSRLRINKKYKNVVFINYIEGTQLFILRCIYDIYRNSNDVDCVIVAVNDLFEFEFEEEYFFKNLADITNDKFDILFFNNGEKHESSQQSLVFSTLLRHGIKDVIYLHEDCFIQKTGLLDNMFKIGREHGVMMVGNVWKTSTSSHTLYRGDNHLFYLNLEKVDKVFRVKDKTTFAGQEVDKENKIKVDPGLGKFAKYLHENREEVYEYDVSSSVIHRGNMFDSYKITLDHYCIFNDLINFKDSVDWVIRNSDTPMFSNHLYMKQYAYMVKKINQYHNNEDVEFIEHVYWMVSDEVLQTNGLATLKPLSEEEKFMRNRYNPDWIPPTEKYIWQEHLGVWTKDA